MPNSNTQNTFAAYPQYNRLSKLFHWSMAALIIFMLCLGLYMEALNFTPQKFQLIQLHKSIGIGILILVAFRLLWRLLTPAPKLDPTIPLFQKLAAHGAHFALYVLMFMMPITGWVMSDAAGYHPNFFGLPVPIITEVNPEVAKFVAERHEQFAWALIAIICVHAAAALFHHFIVKDSTLRRMLPETIARRLP